MILGYLPPTLTCTYHSPSLQDHVILSQLSKTEDFQTDDATLVTIDDYQSIAAWFALRTNSLLKADVEISLFVVIIGHEHLGGEFDAVFSTDLLYDRPQVDV